MNTINYLKGDATRPDGEGVQIIAHVCNDVGAWGKGFVLAVSAKWSQPEKNYKDWAISGDNFKLGEIQLVNCSSKLLVANMIAQHKIRRGKKGVAPIRYEAVRSCLKQLANQAIKLSASVHMPRIGCGLAGGDWIEIEKIISEELSQKNINVTVYDL